MLAKLSSKNQLTLPKAITNELGAVQYFEVELRDGQIVLSPIHLQRADAVRAKLAELQLDSDDLVAALDWARQTKPDEREAQPIALKQGIGHT